MSDVERIARAVAAPALQAWKPEEVVPGDPFRAFTVTGQDGSVIQSGAPEAQQAPPSFDEAEKIVLAAIEQLAKTPARAVTVALRRVAHLLRPARVEADIEIANRGKEPLVLPAFDAPGPSKLVLDVVRQAKDGPDQTFVEPKPAAITATPPPSSGRWIIPPGGAVRLAVKQKVALRPGVHTVQVLLQTRLVDPSGRQDLAVEVRSPPAELKL